MRLFVVIATFILTYALGHTLDKFISLTGALACTPIAFTFPFLFHYKICARSTRQKTIDLSLAVLSIVTMVFCVYKSIVNWNKS